MRSITLEFDGERFEVDLFPPQLTPRQFTRNGIRFQIVSGMIVAESLNHLERPSFRIIERVNPYMYSEITLGGGRWFSYQAAYDWKAREK
jgi:hypothetical protein